MAGITLANILERNPGLQLQLRTISDARLKALAGRRSSAVQQVDTAFDAIEHLLDGSGRRCIVGIGGFPGSGKTSLAIELAERLNIIAGRTVAVHVPMDGFHLRNEVLASRKLDHVKGDVSTYDVDSYLNLLQRFLKQPADALFAPEYDRSRHEVIEHSILITAKARLLITEGIYVGLDRHKWDVPSSLLSLSMFLDTEPMICLERIVARNIQAGRTESVICTKLHNDLRFMEQSLRILENARIVVRR